MDKAPIPNIMIRNKIKIMQINVCGWKSNKLSIQNAIIKEDIDIVLINEHGMKLGETIKINSYNVYKTNTLNERRNGCAIEIKKDMILLKLIYMFILPFYSAKKITQT